MMLQTAVLDAFKKAFETKCVRLVVAAYKSSIVNPAYSMDWMENDFTLMLVKYIMDNGLGIRWGIIVGTESPIYKDGVAMNKGFANTQCRIDIKMCSISKKQEYTFCFEAKRLKEGDSSLQNRYIKTGIDNFISGKYPRGVLLGYLVKGGVEHTINQLNDKLMKANRRDEILVSRDNELFSDYFESQHSHFGILQHYIFNFTI